MKITREFLEQRFQAGFERRLCELTRLFDAGDAAMMSREFHSLVGIGGTYGHPEVTELAREGEKFCETGQLREALRIVVQLQRAREQWSHAA